MANREGGCLCGALRYRLDRPPRHVTVCYCRFCQRATGSDRMVEPIFDRRAFSVTAGTPSVYTLPSEGSGYDIHAHFCTACGTKVALTFARWPDRLGIYAGTLDDPASIDLASVPVRHIFASEARPGTLLPAGVPVFERHAVDLDGRPLEPVVHAAPQVVG